MRSSKWQVIDHYNRNFSEHVMQPEERLVTLKEGLDSDILKILLFKVILIIFQSSYFPKSSLLELALLCYLQKLKRGTDLAFGTHFLRNFRIMFSLFKTLSIDQVSISDLLFILKILNTMF